MTSSDCRVALGAIAAIMSFAPWMTARAGGGSVTPPAAGSTQGLINMEANYRFPPSAAELESFQRHMQMASVILCDATDGQLAIENIHITQGETREQAADIWLMPDDGRSNVNIIPGLGNAAARIEMFYDDVNGGVLAHELVHYVLGLGDEYDEQRRWGGACGIGRGFEPGTEDARNHTLTQRNPAPSCGTFDATGRFVTGGPLCSGDDDCTGGQVCYVSLASELSIDANHDQKTGLTDAVMCPPGMQSSMVNANLRADPSAPVRMFDPTSYDTAETTAIAFTEIELIDDVGDVKFIFNQDIYERSSLRLSLYLAHEAANDWELYIGMDAQQLEMPPGGGIKVLTIIDSVDVTVTPATPGCGDMTVSSALGEECEAFSTPIACTTLTGNAFATGGSASCRADCTWDRTACQYPPPLFGTMTTCGNGIIDFFSSEQCEGSSTLACTAGGGTQACTNCMNDPGPCTQPVATPAGITSNPAAPRLQVQNILTGATDIDIPLNLTLSTGVGSSVSATADGRGSCEVQVGLAECARSFSNADNRFETSDHSLRFNGRSNWAVVKDNYPWMSVPALPVAAAPPECSRVVTFTGDLTGAEQIMVVVDVSGSMSTPVAPGSVETRLDYAREAADLLATLRAGTTAEIGLISFNDTTSLDIPIAGLTPAQRTLFDTALDGYISAGSTAIGEALFATLPELQRVAPSGKDRIVYLVSDGHHNTGRPPADAVAALKAEPSPIQVFTVPISAEADRMTLRDIAAQTQGAMLDAPTGDEVPGVFAEIAARSQGDALLLPRIPMAAAQGCCDPELFDPEFYDSELWAGVPPSQEVQLLVDPGSQSLDVVLTSRNADSSTWHPDIQLSGPDGTIVTNGDPRVSTTQYYLVVRVPSPAPGTWTLEVASSFGPQFSWMVASAANPTSDCFVDAPSIVPDGGTAVVTGDASYMGSLDPATSALAAVVVRPGNSTTPVPLDRAFGNDLVQGSFSDWNGRGAYTAYLGCSADEMSRPLPGDTINGDPSMSLMVEPFAKFASTSFFYDSSQMPPCPIASDCDGDGIPGALEGPGDDDDDGWPNDYDPDSNNDDISDARSGPGDDDGDGEPNFIDDDIDGDGIDNVHDVCPQVADPDQLDADGDRIGDACDDDIDGDGVPNDVDTCPEIPNPSQGPTCPEPDVDFDGDGLPDLLWTSCIAGAQLLWSVDGSTFDVQPFSPGPFLGWHVVGLADLDGDADTDILFQNTLSGATRAWLLDGTVVVDEQDGPTISQAWRYYAAGLRDMDDDGHADIIILDRYFNQVRVRRMDGLTGLNTVSLPSKTSTTGRLQAVADIDNDGLDDLLFYNPLLAQMTLWKMDGLVRTSIQAFDGPLPIFELYVAAVDDFDGDGLNDIMWHNPLLTAATLWAMDGTTRLGEQTIVAPSPIPFLPLSLLPGVIANASGGPLCAGL